MRGVPLCTHAGFREMIGLMQMIWRILVADDDPETRTMVKEMLRSTSLEIDCFADAESALLALRGKKTYHVLISDFMLPGNSGIEFVEIVRSDAKLSGIPVVMISGHGSRSMELRAQASGANRFLYKPFSARQLRSIVEELLKGQARTTPTEPA
jgi:two-component system C4-dicarboxylate transport response regulator DctD